MRIYFLKEVDGFAAKSSTVNISKKRGTNNEGLRYSTALFF